MFSYHTAHFPTDLGLHIVFDQQIAIDFVERLCVKISFSAFRACVSFNILNDVEPTYQPMLPVNHLLARLAAAEFAVH
jgi:hypothetical protein